MVPEKRKLRFKDMRRGFAAHEKTHVLWGGGGGYTVSSAKIPKKIFQCKNTKKNFLSAKTQKKFFSAKIPKKYFFEKK